VVKGVIMVEAYVNLQRTPSYAASWSIFIISKSYAALELSSQKRPVHSYNNVVNRLCNIFVLLWSSRTCKWGKCFNPMGYSRFSACRTRRGERKQKNSIPQHTKTWAQITTSKIVHLTNNPTLRPDNYPSQANDSPNLAAGCELGKIHSLISNSH